MDLFADSEDNNNDIFNLIVVELYELVAEHFLRTSIIDGLHLFKTAIPEETSSPKQSHSVK